MGRAAATARTVGPRPPLKSGEQHYYDEYWSPRGFSPTDMPVGATLGGVLNRYVLPGQCVIDVGCGDGSKGGWLSRRATYFGFDVSPAAVELARSRGLDAEVVSDASELPVADGSVDVALCAEVLEHLFDPFSALLEMHRALGSEGMLVVTVPNIANWRNRLDFALLGRWHPGGDELSVAKPWRDPHIRFFTKSSLGRMLHEAGFEPVELRGLQDVSAAVRLPLLRRWLGHAPAGRLTRALTRLAPSVFANQLYAVARPL
jgi:ubiquinone/menaquinone biosynthesis C-methylase UbiE